MSFVGTVIAVGTPTLTLPRKREREWTADDAMIMPDIDWTSASANISPSARRGAPPLPLAGEGWDGGAAASEIAVGEQKTPTWKVPSRLRSNARTLRKNSTDAERILWSELRDHRLNGLGFRRQVPIASYVADFVCHEALLVIDLDGGQHFSHEGEKSDASRTAAIEAKGFKVLRFSNLDVMTNRVGLLETIAAAVVAGTPTPALPRKRERERTAEAGRTNCESNKP